MNQAEVLIYSGLRLEGQFDAVFEALSEQGVAIYALSDPVKDAGFIIGGFELSETLINVDDPHFWFDPRNWQLTVADLAEALAALDRANADAYRANAAEYIDQLQLLYEWADAGLRSAPEGQRYLVTSHDAFQYFGAAFGWRMQAIQGMSTEDEAGVGDILETVDFVINNDIPVLFVESSIPPDTIEAVIEAVRAQGGEARIGLRELFGDAMGEPGKFRRRLYWHAGAECPDDYAVLSVYGRRRGDSPLAPRLAAATARRALECRLRSVTALGIDRWRHAIC